MKILFTNAYILDLESKSGFIFGDVLVEDDLIKYVGKKCIIKPDRIIDVSKNILMPGFIDAHTHSSMTLLRGHASDVPLEQWLYENIFPKEALLTTEDVYYGTLLAICEYLRAGITCIDEFYFSTEGILKALEETNYRARLSLILPSKKEDIKQALQLQLQRIQKCNLIKPVVTPHSIYLTDEPELIEMITFAKLNNLPISTHLSETLKEVGDCTVKQNNLTPPQYLEELGFFDRKATCYHCVHMDKDDLEILANYDANVVTCPSSNIKLASGIAPVFAMLNKGINVAIGTDGAASNDSLDMFKEMFLVSTLSKVNIYNADAVSVKTILKMATVNGAKALGFNNLGEIKSGNKADLILVDTTKPHWQPVNNKLSHLVYSAKSSDVYFTMINGKILFENGKLNLPISEEEIIKKCNNIYKRINK